MKTTRLRDLSIFDTVPRLVLATDSIGSIGNKPHDALAVDPLISGYYLARVPLLELLCLGAHPETYVVTCSNEMNPTGQAILDGVRQMFAPFRLSSEQENGSSEENMPSSMTAAGITVLATLPEAWQNPDFKSGDWLYLLGWPLVGQAVLDQPDRLVRPEEIVRLRQDERIGVMVPLGSRGIAHELAELGARLNQCLIEIDLSASAGPASAIIFTCSEKLTHLKLESELHCLGQIERL